MAPNWFVGITVPPRGDDGTPWLERVLADLPTGVRPFHAADLHLTVAFLGSVGREPAERAWACAAALEGHPIVAELAGVKALGNPRRPSALSVVLASGGEDAVRVIEQLRAPMISAAGARPDTRPPLPHITIARPTRNCPPAERRRALAWAEGKSPLGQTVTMTQLALYTWAEDRRVRQFRVVAQRNLG